MNRKQAQELVKSLEIDKLYFYCDTFKLLDDYFKNHPNYLEKIKNGHNGYIYSNNKTWGKNNFCLNILDDNNNLIAISVNYSLIGDLKKIEVTKAFRSSIDPEILAFKKTLRLGIDKCAITGVLLTNNINIDHHNFDFKDIVEMFLKKYNKTYEDLYKYVIQIETKRFFNNKDLINYFVKFHNENTTLRFTTQTANLQKNRKK